MNKVLMLLLGLVTVTTMLTGCSAPPPPVEQQGELDVNAEHALVPKDGEVYRIHNLKQPGGKVFIFPSEQALAECYQALETGGDAQAHCWSVVEAEAEDGEMVKTKDCHKSPYAVCMLQVLEGHASGVKGAVMWDWLQSKE